jgi:hypothetical protein
MFESIPFRLFALAALTAYLWYSREKRLRADEAKWLAHQRELAEARRQEWKSLPPGTAFDAASIIPQMHRLRQEHQACQRRGLVAAFRQVVRMLPFFQRARSRPELN